MESWQEERAFGNFSFSPIIFFPVSTMLPKILEKRYLYQEFQMKNLKNYKHFWQVESFAIQSKSEN